MPDEILTLAEMAQMLKVADKTVYTMAPHSCGGRLSLPVTWLFW